MSNKGSKRSYSVADNYSYLVGLPILVVAVFCFGFILAHTENSKSSLASSNFRALDTKYAQKTDTTKNLSADSAIGVTNPQPHDSIKSTTPTGINQSENSMTGVTYSQLKTYSPQVAGASSQSAKPSNVQKILPETSSLAPASSTAASSGSTASSIFDTNLLNSPVQIVNSTSSTLGSAL